MLRIRSAEQRVSRMTSAEPEYLEALLDLARALLFHFPVRAVAVASEAAALALAQKDAEGYFEAVYTQASGSLAVSDLDGADAAIAKVAEAAQGPAQDARVLTLRATRAQRRGDLARGLALILEAMQLWERVDPTLLLRSAATHNSAGTLFAQLGDYAGAIEQFQLALDRVGHNVDDDIYSVVSSNLGRAHRELRQFERAEQVLVTALARFPDDDASFGRAIQLVNLGMVLVEAGRPAEGIRQSALAQQLGVAGGYPRVVAAAHHTLGLALRSEGDPVAAKGEFEAAMRIRSELGERTDLAETQICYAQLLRELQEHGAAEALLLGLIEGAQATALVRPRVDALHLLYQINRERGDLAQALDYHVAYAEQNRVLVNDVAALQYQALQERYRHEQLMREREAERARGAAFEVLAHTDPLTGIPNRRFADAHIDAALAHAAATGRSLSVCILDIDYFKQVNDTHSHEVGDAVLRAVGQLLQSQLRDGDVVARYGGEEFVVVFSGASVQQAEEATVRLLSAVRSHDWSGRHPALSVTMSAGVADIRSGFDRAALLAAADTALYQAKAAGRDRVVRSG